ncbi:MAG TPA: NADPH:quinone reductase [Vicinamibacterales bacterium]|jgi:NADPH2:quinone reductase
MRAIVVHEFGSPAVMRLENIATLTPSPSQVLVRVRAAGVNPVDTYVRAGTYALKPPLPYTPGNDGAGEVESVGAEVKGFKPGDRVYIANDNTGSPRTGIYAEHALCAPTQLHPLPDGVSFAQGAAIGVPYGTVCYALFKRANGRPGETVLIHGASGGVGIAAVQICRAHGMTVIGTAGSERGLQAVRDQGAHLVFNHKEPGYLDEIAKASGGRGVDVILETNAHINFDKDLTLLSRSGRLVLIGSRGRVEIDPRGIMGREASVLGMVLFNVAAPEFVWMHAAIGAGLANGTLKPLVGREIPLADAAKAHEAVMEPGALGKIVLVS